MSPQESNESNKGIVQRCFGEVWNEGNLAAITGLVHANFIRHHERNQDEDLHGPEGFQQWVSQTRLIFPDLRLTVERMFGEGDRVMAHVRGRGTHTAELKGVAATGIEVDWTITAIVRVGDGKIAECWVIADTLGILQQLGSIQRIQ